MSDTVTRTYFTSGFSDYACPGDRIVAKVGHLTLTAKIEHDSDTGRPDKELDGFWPSFDPENDGYIGPNKTRSDLDAQTQHMQRVLDGWLNDDWFWCGIVIKVSCEGVMLDDSTSLWSIDCNWPREDGSTDNSYLLDVANDLAPEAIKNAERVLARLCSPTPA